MNKKIIKLQIVIIVGFLFYFNFASASVVINEFVSHPNSGEQEWVELRNTGDSPVDLTGWKLTELSSPNKDNQTENDLLSLSGIIDDILVFDVGESKLNDAGDSIGLYNGSVLADRVTYGSDSTVKNYSIDLVASTIGKSGALISGSWQANQDPTKNLPNLDSNNSNENTNEIVNSNSNVNSNSSSSFTKKEPVVLKITTKIISPKIVTAGIPFCISSLTNTNRDETYTFGRFVWNFGDGMMSQKNNSETFKYLYEYPGDYALTLSYFATSFSKIPESTDRVIIKVVPAEIFISGTGDINDPFIEINNKSNYEVDLSGWVLTASRYYFNFPEGMILLPNKTVKLSPKITGFTKDDLDNITITNSNKEIVATYPLQPKTAVKSYTSSKNISNNLVPLDNKTDPTPEDSQVINLNDLGASAGNSGLNSS
ncbi:MAG: lamin tail domain-containing protein, partial [Bacteroidetes bacterium]|nr:lamin tail domain-containing protein [Bacteroidota bacterium]